MTEKSADAVCLQGPDDPTGKKDHRHCEGHVQVGIGTAEEWVSQNKMAGWILMAPAHGANARNQPEPVTKQHEDKDCREEPNRLLHEFSADNVLKKLIETFDEPLPKVLCAVWHLLDVPSRELRKCDETDSHDPCYNH